MACLFVELHKVVSVWHSFRKFKQKHIYPQH